MSQISENKKNCDQKKKKKKNMKISKALVYGKKLTLIDITQIDCTL